MRDMCGIKIGVTPLQGWLFFRFQYPGLKPWAIVVRPLGAWCKTSNYSFSTVFFVSYVLFVP